MTEFKNKPYVKQFDSDGVPIPFSDLHSHGYISPFQNRRQRRERLPRQMNNRKGISLTIFGEPAVKYRRRVQIVNCKDGTKRRILHYLTDSTSVNEPKKQAD